MNESTNRELEVASALKVLDRADRACLDLFNELAGTRHCFHGKSAAELAEINELLESIRERVIAVKGE